MVLDIAELVSGGVCEVCGNKGNVKIEGGWARCRCFEHESFSRRNFEVVPVFGRVEGYVRSVASVIFFYKENSLCWVNNNCHELAGRRPLELLSTVDGCNEVVGLIRRFEHGVGA
ncbi:MbcA/ParS/Xre antitoxin family protein [Pseudomonas sp. NPDC089743]|uniref:MbcA/ParS/Xre antitoxin family protein n=1 Tax=Pseudomonas sp. NPDC089743 TaxID=3364471 RepID=UPI0038160B7F